MEMIAVQSSQISEVGWEEREELGPVLWVRFHSGALYEYANVSKAWFDAFLRAESKGKFFVGIKRDPKSYPYRQIEPARPKPPKASRQHAPS